MHYKYQIINVYASTWQLRPLNIKWELFFVLSADYTSTKRVNHRRDQQQRFVSTSRLVLRFKCWRHKWTASFLCLLSLSLSNTTTSVFFPSLLRGKSDSALHNSSFSACLWQHWVTGRHRRITGRSCSTSAWASLCLSSLSEITCM